MLKRVSNSLNSGFTIVELVVVVAVIGILAAITIIGYESVQKSARVAQMQSDYEKIENAISIYEARNGVFPRCTSSNECNMSDLVANLNTEGLATTGPDGSAIRYVVASPNYDAWAVRFVHPETESNCKQGFNPPENWWSHAPACW